jgi:hypothetical protein
MQNPPLSQDMGPDTWRWLHGTAWELAGGVGWLQRTAHDLAGGLRWLHGTAWELAGGVEVAPADGP